MSIKISDEFDEISLPDMDRQLTDDGSDTALPEFIEEQLRYEQVIRELTEFEEAYERTDSTLVPTTYIGE